MNDTLANYGTPAVLAALVHGLALAALLYHYTPTGDELRRMAPENVIQAELVAMTAATSKPSPSTPPPPSSRRDPDFEPVPSPLDPVITPENTPAAERARPQSDREDARNLRELEQRALDEAMDAEAAAVDAQLGVNEIASFIARINQRVGNEWSRPPSARREMLVWLAIELVPTGEVVAVSVSRSSGDAAFDRSAVDAVRAVRRFEVPSDRRLFEAKFRRMLFRFSPKDLMR